MNDRTNEVFSAPSVERYRHHIAHLGLPYERETEMIEALRSFLSGVVDRAFGHDPIRLAAGDRLQLSGEGPTPAVLVSEPISSHNDHDLTDAFETANADGQRKR